MTFMFVGDTHGDVSFVSTVCKVAQSQDVDTIIQLGDFGIWDHEPRGKYFLDTLNDNAARRGVKWIFVDGNHENHENLAVYKANNLLDNGMVEVRENIHWTGRTNVFEVDGMSFAAIGGAVSIDRYARIEGESWWRGERTEYGDVMYLAELVDSRYPDGVDFLISHDGPSTIEPWEGFIKDDEASNANRSLMSNAAMIARPKWWFHGHYHKFMKYRFYDTRVYGLGCNPYIPVIREKNVAIVHPEWNSNEPFVFMFLG